MNFHSIRCIVERNVCFISPSLCYALRTSSHDAVLLLSEEGGRNQKHKEEHVLI